MTLALLYTCTYIAYILCYHTTGTGTAGTAAAAAAAAAVLLLS